MNPSGSRDNAPPPSPVSAAALAPRFVAPSSFQAENTRKSVYVAYSHTPLDASLAESDPVLTALGDVVMCGDFDDLLNLLEVDAVAGIVFDQTVGTQEIHYITRWARIFRPTLQTLQRPFSKLPGHAAFFSSQQI